MKKRTTLFLCIFFSAVYLFWLFLYNHYFMPETAFRVHTRQVSPDIIMVGKDDSRSAKRSFELLPGETININTADEQDLQRLTGIGDALSSAILQYRDMYGPFQTIEDIKKVPGIGESRYQAICDFITVGGET